MLAALRPWCSALQRRKAAADSPATAVLDWNKHALDALANAPTAPDAGCRYGDTGAGHTPGNGAGRGLRRRQLDRRGYQPYLDVPSTSGSASQAAAAATAAHDVLVEVLNQTPLIGHVHRGRSAGDHRSSQPAREPKRSPQRPPPTAPGPSQTASRPAKRAAAAMIGARAGDGRWGPFRFTCGEAPGQWRPISSTGLHDAFGPERPVRLGRQGQAVRRREQRAVPERGPACAQHRRVRQGLQRGQEPSEPWEARAAAEQQALFDFFQANPVEMYYRSFRDVRASAGPRPGRAGAPLRQVRASRAETRSSTAGRARRTGATGVRRRRSASAPTTATRRPTGTPPGRRPIGNSALWGHGLRLQLRDRIVYGGRRALLRAGTHDLRRSRIRMARCTGVPALP